MQDELQSIVGLTISAAKVVDSTHMEVFMVYFGFCMLCIITLICSCVICSTDRYDSEQFGRCFALLIQNLCLFTILKFIHMI
jgi:hypothetical protein